MFGLCQTKQKACLLYDIFATIMSSSASSSSSLSCDAHLSSLLASLRSSSSPSYTSVLSFIHYLLENALHYPEYLREFGLYLLSNYSSKLGDWKWEVLERVFIAALELQDQETATNCLTELRFRFTASSARVQRLTALQFESLGRYDAASEIYNDILSKDKANLFCLKRSITILKQKGKIDEAIKSLNRYVKICSSDDYGWLELYDLYLHSSQYELAGFCCEELILLVPEHWYYHLCMADCCYAVGKYEIARQYYSQSLQLKPNNNLRANYGIIAAIKSGATGGNAIVSSSSSSSSSSGSGSNKNLAAGTTAAKLYSWSVDKLMNHYTKYNPEMLSVVKQSLEVGESIGMNEPTATISS